MDCNWQHLTVMSALILTGAADTLALLSQLVRDNGMEPICCSTTADALSHLRSQPSVILVFICALGTSPADACWPVLAEIPSAAPLFSIIFSRTASGNPRLRLDGFAAGARMVTDRPGGVGTHCLMQNEVKGAVALAQRLSRCSSC